MSSSCLFTRFIPVIFTFFPLFSAAQNPKLGFKHVNIAEGLSNSTIESITQDSKGFIWIGTRDGLDRYDGHDIVVYKNDPLDSSSLSDNFIRTIYEDKEHILWIGTSNGLNRYNDRQNNFSRYKHGKEDRGTLSNNNISSILEDSRGILWVGTDGGLDLFDKTGGAFLSYLHDERNEHSLIDDRVNSIFEDSHQRLWIGTGGGLCLFDRDNRSFTSRFHTSIPAENDIEVIQEAGPKSLWLGTRTSGLILFDPAKNTSKFYHHDYRESSSLSTGIIKCLLTDHKGNLWVGSINGGLELYDTATNGFTHYQNEPDNSFSLSQRSVSALFEDDQNNLWVGTHRGGIDIYMPGAQKFNLYRQRARDGSLSYNDVKSFFEDKEGHLWVGTDGGGLDLFDRATGHFSSYHYDPLNSKSLGSDDVLDIMQDSRDNLWVSTWSGGLNLFDPKKGTFTRFTNREDDPTSISSNFVQKTFEDKDGNLWIATYFGGLDLLDRKTKKFSRFMQSSPGNILTGNNINSIDQDRKGRIWLGTDDGGLNCYDPAGKRITHYFNNGEKMPDIRVIFIDSKGRLWIGQKGLYLFNEDNNSFALYTDKAGLSTEFIKGITEDEQGNFWIATSNGLTKFNPDDRSFEKYDTEDGLQSLEYETGSFLKTRNGEMFFGGVNGFNSFYPSSIRINQFTPPVYITSFQIFNEDMNIGQKNSPLKEDITLTKEIHLSYKQSTFSFNFSALNYTSPENNKYSYKLEGFDPNWNYAGTERKANYTNLNPGEYLFRVKASNNDGVWNGRDASIRIIISPPFWKTTWFYALLCIFTIACIYTFFRWKKERDEKEREEKKRDEINQFQLQFFTNVSHEFRTPLTLILGPLEKLMRENVQASLDHYYHSMQRNVHRLMDLINELMDFRKIETNALKLNVRPVNLSAFLKEIVEEFEEWADQKHIGFLTRNLDSINEVWLDKQVIEKIILNLLTNSFKYTASGGHITLEVLASLDDFKPSFTNELVVKGNYRAKKNFYLRVADNGIGISKDSIQHLFERYFRITEAHLGSGVGLAFVKSLTFLHKGNIWVYSTRHKGTEIIIAIPLGEENYSKNEKLANTGQEGIVRLESLDNKYEHSLPLKKENKFNGRVSTDVNGQRPPDDLRPEHILVVEDNEELRDFLEDCLQPYYHVDTAPDGKTGLEKALEDSPNLIISDVVMPGMDGVQLCKAIKEHIDTSHIPFIILTAKDAVGSKIEGVGSGADFYFTKPLSIELLLATIRNIFDQNKKLKERFTRDFSVQIKDLVHNNKDKEFMEQLLGIIESQLTNPDMDIDYLCSKIGMSRTKLYNKIRNICGQSINDFIRTIRLKKAVEIMTHEEVPFLDVMYRIGIQSQSYFTKAFKKEFGKTPSQFIQELNR